MSSLARLGADPGGKPNAGETYVVFGQATGWTASLDLSSLNGSNGFRLDGIDVADESGFSVSGAGDVNGDGFDDVIIGAYADPAVQVQAKHMWCSARPRAGALLLTYPPERHQRLPP
jgi:hypothetical protein